MINDFEWIFNKDLNEGRNLPEMYLCKAMLYQIMTEIAWHKIMLSVHKDRKKWAEVIYVRSIKTINYIMCSNDDPFSFIYLCNMTNAKTEMIKKFLSIKPESFFKNRIFRNLIYKVKKKWVKDKWEFQNNGSLIHHDINLNIDWTYEVYEG